MACYFYEFVWDCEIREIKGTQKFAGFTRRIAQYNTIFVWRRIFDHARRCLQRLNCRTVIFLLTHPKLDKIHFFIKL